MSSAVPTVDYPRPFEVTPSDHGGIALIVTTLLMTWAILCLFIRLYVRITTLSSPKGPDDLLCAAATTVGIIQTIVAGVSVGRGFGRAADLVSDASMIRYEKEQYAVDILCILAIMISKLATIFLYVRITPRKDQQKTSFGLAGLVIACGIASMCIVGARCGANMPWANLTRVCSDYVSGWTAVTVLDVLTELLLFAMPIWILFDLQMALRTKVIVMAAFALRLPVIAASIVHVCVVNDWSNSPTLVTAVAPFICLQVETQYAIMATTFPCLVPFMKSVNTHWGTFTNEEAQQYGGGSVGDSHGASRNKSGAHSKLRSGKKGSITSGSNGGNDGIALRALRPDGDGYNFRIPADVGKHDDEQRSSTDSKQMIIRKTISTSVQFD